MSVGVRDPRPILLLGGSGQTGWELQRTLAPLAPIVAPPRRDADLADGKTLRTVVRDIGPGVIVNAAAFNGVDAAEDDPRTAQAVNGEAPGILAEEAKRSGAWLVHYSTDYVFGADPARDAEGRIRPFREDDPPAPLGAYGRSKFAGEEAVRAMGCDHLILRTSWVYSLRGRTFLAALLRLETTAAELRIVDDQVSSPTWARSLAEGTAQILAIIRSQEGRPAARGGTYHLAGEGTASRFGFARAAFEIFTAAGRRVPRLISTTTAEFPARAVRPSYSGLDSQRIRESFGIALPAWQADLALCLAE